MGKKRQKRPEKHNQDLGAQIEDPTAFGVRVSCAERAAGLRVTAVIYRGCCWCHWCSSSSSLCAAALNAAAAAAAPASPLPTNRADAAAWRQAAQAWR
jgi:hypothetical protein